ncbi:hypothetical protein [Flavobacterium johnsoniae]|uniref:Uncharacterized protein n=1 Tax=Flavobacterium johnsoniae TaxID=986 RepID=A0A1J7BPG9_FLAJO|nr:hypothetical protein [Flavobacterium johnsoniae]OIV40595.1 hypothetical protein BKM63_17155 [Flavobacterium johnsoniae]
MENSNQYTAEELQKCPYHNHQAAAGHDDPSENTGDWGDLDENDEAGTDPDRHEGGGNDNSGGAGSSGSAATNS